MAAPKATSFDDVTTYFRYKVDMIPITLHVGDEHIIYYEKPSNKRQREQNKLQVVLIGFDDDFAGDPVVKLVEGGRQFKANINHLLPMTMIDLIDTSALHDTSLTTI